METKALSKAKALNFLSTINNIHAGGCLIAALTFFRNEQRAGRGKKFQLVCLSHNKNEYMNNKLRIEKNSHLADSTAHFGWTYDGGKSVYDCKGKIERRYDYVLLVPQHLTETFSIEAINNGSWNPMFDREKNIPFIANFFKLNLSDLDLAM